MVDLPCSDFLPFDLFWFFSHFSRTFPIDKIFVPFRQTGFSGIDVLCALFWGESYTFDFIHLLFAQSEKYWRFSILFCLGKMKIFALILWKVFFCSRKWFWERFFSRLLAQNAEFLVFIGNLYTSLNRLTSQNQIFTTQSFSVS